jgi:siroheme synthase
MPGRDLSAIAAQLRSDGLQSNVPCAIVSRAAQPDQQVQRTTLAHLDRLRPGPQPTVLLVGEALGAQFEQIFLLRPDTLSAVDAANVRTEA